MTAKGVFLFFILLLYSGTSFPFPKEINPSDGQETLGNYFEFEEEVAELYKGTVPVFQTNVYKAHSFVGSSRSFLFQDDHESEQSDYLKRSRQIIPGLDVPDIIFPFHGFL